MSTLEPDKRAALFALYRAGDHAGLAEAAQRLLAGHPADPLLLGLLGAARQALGDHAAAIEHYRRALAVQPDNTRLHNSLGVACLHCADIDAAIAAFQRALAGPSPLPAARFNLGLACSHARQWERAAGCFEAVLQTTPGHAGALSGLADCRLALGRTDGVEALYRQAIETAPAQPTAHRGLLGFLDQANRVDDLAAAVAAAQRACGDADFVRLWAGILAGRQGDLPAAIAALSALHFDDSRVPECFDERRRLSQLARLYDETDRPAQAFQAAEGANRISARICADAGIKQDLVRQRLHRSRALLEAGPPTAAAVAGRQQPVFVVGFPRSGTTLVDTLLRGHRAIAVAEESPAAARLAQDLHGGGAPLPALAEAYLGRLAAAAPGGPATRVRIDRFAMNLQYVVEILQVFPAARFVLVLRHPADCVLSACMQTFDDNAVSAHLLTLADAVELYDAVFSLWLAATEQLRPAVHTLRYEALVADPESVSRGLLGFLGLPWDSNVLHTTATAARREFIRTVSHDQVVRPLHSGASGRHRRYAQALAPIWDRLEPWLDRLGYRAPA